MVVLIGDTNSVCVVTNNTVTCNLGDSKNLKGQNVPIFVADSANDRSSVAPYGSFHYCNNLFLVTLLIISNCTKVDSVVGRYC
jgi:hypothetical protein